MNNNAHPSLNFLRYATSSCRNEGQSWTFPVVTMSAKLAQISDPRRVVFGQKTRSLQGRFVIGTQRMSDIDHASF